MQVHAEYSRSRRINRIGESKKERRKRGKKKKKRPKKKRDQGDNDTPPRPPRRLLLSSNRLKGRGTSHVGRDAEDAFVIRFMASSAPPGAPSHLQNLHGHAGSPRGPAEIGRSQGTAMLTSYTVFAWKKKQDVGYLLGMPYARADRSGLHQLI